MGAEIPFWQQWVLLYSPAISAGMLAAIFTSFACVVAERARSGASLQGVSRCVCGRAVRPWFNVPILGWVVQLGKARCCGARIPVRYVLAEGVAAVVAGVSFFYLEVAVAVIVSTVAIICVALPCALVSSGATEVRGDSK